MVRPAVLPLRVLSHGSPSSPPGLWPVLSLLLFLQPLLSLSVPIRGLLLPWLLPKVLGCPGLLHTCTVIGQAKCTMLPTSSHECAYAYACPGCLQCIIYPLLSHMLHCFITLKLTELRIEDWIIKGQEGNGRALNHGLGPFEEQVPMQLHRFNCICFHRLLHENSRALNENYAFKWHLYHYWCR